MEGSAFGQGNGLGLRKKKKLGQPKIDKKVIEATPPVQPGVAASTVGQNTFIRTERYQYTAPPPGIQLTQTDPDFNLVNGDGYPDLTTQRANPAGPWNPILFEPWVAKGRRQQAYDWANLTPHSQVVRTRMKGGNFTSAPAPQAYTIPIERPVPPRRRR